MGASMFDRVRGAIRFFTERFGGRPFVDCLICAIMVVLRFMGEFMADGMQKNIRAAMPGSPTGGTTVGMNMAALRALGCPVLPHTTAVDDATFLASLKTIGGSKRGKSVFAVWGRNTDLPADSPTRRITGRGYTGLHAITVVAKTADGAFVYVINPMGRDINHPPKPTPPGWEPYTGNLEPTANIMAFVRRTDTGKIKAVWGTYNEGHATPTPAGV